MTCSVRMKVSFLSSMSFMILMASVNSTQCSAVQLCKTHGTDCVNKLHSIVGGPINLTSHPWLNFKVTLQSLKGTSLTIKICTFCSPMLYLRHIKVWFIQILCNSYITGVWHLLLHSSRMQSGPRADCNKGHTASWVHMIYIPWA